eukprot:TRINITY_DN517_c1_g2_i1.p1 TRINITY_DN517_c1_g2~~TRINITY_DN517_c1_g2_i1.p1  ORF type:complete len:138 (+),score=21.16 TRINITY_DN517_c1_g2_i1:101-514(+)
MTEVPSFTFTDASSDSSDNVPKAKKKESKKVVLLPGYSQMDWAKLQESGRDLSGTGGRFRRISKEEVKQHRTVDDAWMIYRGKVYNITPYMNYHPGGIEELMKSAGRDGTKLFERTHAWVNGEALLRGCLVGFLDSD